MHLFKNKNVCILLACQVKKLQSWKVLLHSSLKTFIGLVSLFDCSFLKILYYGPNHLLHGRMYI